MKAGGVAVALAMMVLSWNVQLQGAEAQTVTCLEVDGAEASFDNATTAVELLRMNEGQCCKQANEYCTIQLTIGTAAIATCGSPNICYNCAGLGDKLNLVLEQCNNPQNMIKGVYQVDDTDQTFFLANKDVDFPH